MVGSHINWEAQPLGQVSDEEIGRRLGVSAAVVGYHRRAMDIEAYQASTQELAERGRKGKKRYEIDWSVLPLGKESDRKIANGLGVSASMVRKVRISLGIPPAHQEVRRPREFRVRDYGPPAKPHPGPPPLRLPNPTLSVGWLGVGVPPQGPEEVVSLPEPPPAPEPSPDETARLVELGLVHVHICPMCRERRTCSRDDCQAMGLETEDGAPYSYKTCPSCVGRLEYESGTTGQRLVVNGGRLL